MSVHKPCTATMKLGEFRRKRQARIEETKNEKITSFKNNTALILVDNFGYDSEKAIEIAGSIVDNNYEVVVNADKENEIVGRREINKLKEECKKVNESEYLLLSAPLKDVTNTTRGNLGLAEDTKQRDIQFQNFVKVLQDKNLQEADPKVVMGWDFMLRTIEQFLRENYHACEHMIIFNGHGSKDGLCLQEESKAIPLDKVIESIRSLCVKSVHCNNVKIVFAQCFGHMHSHTEKEDKQFHVINFTSRRRSKSISLIKMSDGTDEAVVAESRHVDLELFAKKRNKSFNCQEIDIENKSTPNQPAFSFEHEIIEVEPLDGDEDSYVDIGPLNYELGATSQETDSHVEPDSTDLSVQLAVHEPRFCSPVQETQETRTDDISNSQSLNTGEVVCISQFWSDKDQNASPGLNQDPLASVERRQDISARIIDQKVQFRDTAAASLAQEKANDMNNICTPVSQDEAGVGDLAKTMGNMNCTDGVSVSYVYSSSMNADGRNFSDQIELLNLGIVPCYDMVQLYLRPY